MIETKILDAAGGVQRQDVIDQSETTPLPSLNNGVIIGYFKRGRMDKPFKVTASNYKALLGHDPSNPSYLMIEDIFKRGIDYIIVQRVGSAGKPTVPPVIPPVIPPKPTVPPPPNGAITSLSGWYLKNHSISGDKVYLDALKQTSLGGLKSSIVAAASVADLMQHLLSDGSIDALDYAVNGLLGAGVKWTLDKENQRISYTAIL